MKLFPAKISPYSKDPSGFLFEKNGTLYRQVNFCYKNDYDHLMSSGLYEALVNKHILISHEECPQSLALNDSAYKILKPRPVTFISYAHEWSFGGLQEAALTTLEIQKHALAHGMTLKDASSHNIQFGGTRPLLIDSLSFEIYEQGKPWAAYRQFCENFLAPLALMSAVDIRCKLLNLSFADGIPLDFAYRLLPWQAKIRPAYFLRLGFHGKSYARGLKKNFHLESSLKISRTKLIGLLDYLEGIIRSLRPKSSQSQWSHYEPAQSYTREAWEIKKKIVSDYVEKNPCRLLWDFGANAGIFSKLAARHAQNVVALDQDLWAIEKCYREFKEQEIQNVLPLSMDLTYPSPRVGWGPGSKLSLEERGPADMILALALLHHWCLGRNMALARIAEWFHQITRKSLLIEWIPKSDPQVQEWFTSRPDIFTDYDQDHFRKVMSAYFEVRATHPLPGSQRILYVLEKR